MTRPSDAASLPCGCRADTELGMAAGCAVCGHRDHGSDGCRVMVADPDILLDLDGYSGITNYPTPGDNERAAAPVAAVEPPCASCGHSYIGHLMGVACCDCAGYAAPVASDRQALWDKFTGGEKLAYGIGYRDAEADTPALDVDVLAAALHGDGAADAPVFDFGTCVNWEPGWGDECGPDKHADEAARLAARYARLSAEGTA